MTPALGWIVAAAFLGSLAGCDSTPLAPDQGRPIPADRIHASELMRAAQPHEVTTTLTRDWSVQGIACQYDLYLADRLVVSVIPGERIRLAVPAGRQRWRMETGGLACPVFATTAEAEAAPGGAVAVRLGITNARPSMSVTAAP